MTSLKRKQHWIFYVIILFSLSACVKHSDPDPNFLKDHTEISGQVLQYGPLTAVEGVSVILRQGRTNGFLGNISWEFLDTILTDQNGRYAYNFVHREGFNEAFIYELWLRKDDYFGGEIAIQPRFRQVSDVIMDPIGYLNVHLKNTNPADKFDQIRTNSDGGGGVYTGELIDTIELHTCKGARKIRFTYIVRKFGAEKKFIDSIYIHPFQIYKYILNY